MSVPSTKEALGMGLGSDLCIGVAQVGTQSVGDGDILLIHHCLQKTGGVLP